MQTSWVHSETLITSNISVTAAVKILQKQQFKKRVIIKNLAYTISLYCILITQQLFDPEED